MKEDEREKGQEKEAFDPRGVMLQDMIGVPAFDQFIQAVVFDVPSLMSRPTARSSGTFALLREWITTCHARAPCGAHLSLDKRNRI